MKTSALAGEKAFRGIATGQNGVLDRPRVLVVDDNPAIRETLYARLSQLGCDPVAVASGEAALSLLSTRSADARPWDLVVLDQVMTGLSGTDVLGSLRQHDRTVPVVMLTSHGSVPLAVAFMRQQSNEAPGGTAFLEKPLPPEPLFGTLMRSLIAEGRVRRRLIEAEAEARRMRTDRLADQSVLLDSLPYPALLLDAVGRVRSVNRAYQSPGYDGDARLGDDYALLFWKRIQAERAADGIRAVVVGRRKTFTYRYQRPNRKGEGHSWWRLHVCRPAHGEPGALVSHFDITEEVEVQTRLRNVNQRLQGLAEHLPARALVVRAEGAALRVKFAAGADQAEAGSGAELPRDRSLRELLSDPETCAAAEAACRRALEGEPTEYEFSEEERDYLVQVQPIRDSDHELSEALWVSTDVTLLKQVRAEAERNARFAERIIELSFGVFVYDLEAERIVFQNSEFTRITEWTESFLATLSPAGFFDLFHPEDRPRILSHIESIRHAGDSVVVDLECRILTGGGRTRWMAIRDAVYERSADGRVSRIMGTCVDITEKKRAEAARRDLAASQARLLEELSEGVLVVDRAGYVVSGNRAAHALLGYPDQALVGTAIETLFPAEAGRSGGSGSFLADLDSPWLGAEEPITARRRDGRPVPVTVMVTSYADQAGAMALMLISDASAKEARRQAELRAAVAEEARKVSEALVLNVMHQLGNHLQDLYVFFHLIRHRSRKRPERIGEVVEKAAGTLQVMGESFDRMQALVCADVGAGAQNYVPFDVNDLFSRIEGEMGPRAVEAGVMLTWEPTDAVALVEPQLITEAIRNLVANSIKFSGPGASVVLSATVIQSEVELRVSDTGIGVPEAEYDRIFHPLYRGAEVRDGRLPGAGIGLAIVARIVALHGGRVWVEDHAAAATAANPRGGAVVKIRLPIVVPKYTL